MLVDEGFIILKYYLDISKEEQAKRLKDRETDPLKQWKVSPVDKEALKFWKDYSEARNEMLLRTNFKHAPWFVVKADKKKTAHIALITHILRLLKYHNKDEKLLSHNYGLVYPSTLKNIKEKLF
jgi:polyphosphate kinase 2 (PPK2 family)